MQENLHYINCLIGQDRFIVTDKAGTTRDVYIL